MSGGHVVEECHQTESDILEKEIRRAESDGNPARYYGTDAQHMAVTRPDFGYSDRTYGNSIIDYTTIAKKKITDPQGEKEDKSGNIIRKVTRTSLFDNLKEYAVKVVKEHFGIGITFGQNELFSRYLISWLIEHHVDIVNRYCRKNLEMIDAILNKSFKKEDVCGLCFENDAQFLLKVAPATFMYVHPKVDNGVITIVHECYIFGKSAYRILREIISNQDAFEIDTIYRRIIQRDSSSIHRESMMTNLSAVPIHTPASVFLPADDENNLYRYLRNAMGISKELCDEYGIVKNPSILLYGLPGTGKTSLCLDIAKRLKSPIYYLTSFDSRAREMLGEEPSRWKVVVFEDLDRVLDREVLSDQEGQELLRTFLQFLDGAMALERSIIIATMNHPENVDDAVIRPGRFDFRLEMKPAEKEIAKKICDKFKVGYDILEEQTYPVLPAELQSKIINNLAELRKKNNRKNK